MNDITVDRIIEEVAKHGVSAKTGKDTPFYKSQAYNTLHEWLRRNHPKSNHCSNCGAVATKRIIDWANITGTYSRDIENYKALCRPCHVLLDKREPSEYCFKGHQRVGGNLRTRVRGKYVERICVKCDNYRSAMRRLKMKELA